MTEGPGAVSWGRLAGAVFFVSAGVLAFEVCLLRILLVASWHHFAFLVISIALLGFGASGTLLTLFRRVLLARGLVAMPVLIVLAASAMPLAVSATQHVPIDVRLVPTLLWTQLAGWLAYWALLAFPFLLGAGAIGLGLMLIPRREPLIYASNLLGSAAGCAAAPLVMGWLSASELPAFCGAVSLLGLLPLWRSITRGTRLTVLFLVACTASFVGFTRAPVRMDSFKYGAALARLEHQGSVRRSGESFGSRGLLEIYEGDVLHDFPFLRGSTSPPRLAVLTVDGHWAGSILQPRNDDETAVVEQTLMAVPYRLAPERPHVLLLGEVGGLHVHLGRRNQAASIDVVHADPNLLPLLRRVLRGRGAEIFEEPSVHRVTAESRHFVDHAAEGSFDLIQLVGLEGSAAGSGGVAGLGEDYLATVEGIRQCLRLLRPDGVLSVTRGIQTPPRDNLKLLATFREALAGLGAPREHLAIVRDFLAVCTMARRTPWSPDEIDSLRALCRQEGLTPVWFPGITAVEVNQPDELPGPLDEPGDWYYHAAVQLLEKQNDEFLHTWPFDIRPARDDRPYFRDFFKLGALKAFHDAFGDLWLTRVELAFLFVLAALGATLLSGLLLTLLPLLVLKAVRQRASSCPGVSIYFASIGLGYLSIEMVVLSRLTRWIGDPVIATAVTIASFLFFSGLGSLWAQRFGRGTRAEKLLPKVVSGIVVFALGAFVLAEPIGRIVSALPLEYRCFAAAGCVAPLALLMGFPMPLGLARLGTSSATLMPWAWGINGFASVVAAPLTVAVSMSWGSSLAAALGVGLYLLPGWLLRTFPTADGPKSAK